LEEKQNFNSKTNIYSLSRVQNSSKCRQLANYIFVHAY